MPRRVAVYIVTNSTGLNLRNRRDIDDTAFDGTLSADTIGNFERGGFEVAQASKASQQKYGLVMSSLPTKFKQREARYATREEPNRHLHACSQQYQR
jgi:hypothetical protein